MVCTILRIYYFILIARALLSWFPHLPAALRPVGDFIYFVTEPLVRLVRPLLPPLRIGNVGLDLSILLLFFLLLFVTQAICR